MDSATSQRQLDPSPGLAGSAAVVPSVSHRLEYVDGLRALAALWVAFHHAIETAVPERALNTPVLGPILASLFKGQFPVMVFLMLSGFCLYYPYVRKNPKDPRFSGFGTYMKRRATRIAPPYLIAGILCLLMAAVPALQVGRWGEIVNPIDGKVVLSHLLFVHNLIPAHYDKIDYPMWSIGLEMQLYLLFPLLVWSFRRYRTAITLAVTLAMVVVIRGGYKRIPQPLSAIFRDGPFSYLVIFALGMAAAALIARGRTAIVPRWVLGLVTVAGFTAVRLGSGNGLVHDLATSAAAFCLLLLAAAPEGGVGRFLSAGWLVKIGIFSYSFYLVHAPLLHLFWLPLRRLSLSEEARFALLSLVAMPLIVVISYGFHRLFERPFMRVKPSAKVA